MGKPPAEKMSDWGEEGEKRKVSEWQSYRVAKLQSGRVTETTEILTAKRELG
jgi:hypothetical protein